jgi:hypothetical protein
MPKVSDQLECLTQLNLDDLIVSMGWERWRLARWIGGGLFYWPARKFARQVIGLDQDVAALGLQEGARRFLPLFSQGLRTSGVEQIPTGGPLLIFSNHPGMADTLALFTAIPRSDLHVVGLDRPFLRQLPAISSRMIYIPTQEEGRLPAIRSVLSELQSGGAILTFPAGHIEPDPAVLPGAVESLADWSESIALFIRKVPEVNIVGAVVSHVLAPQATFHPLTRLRRQKKDRERMGASIQLVMRTLFPNVWSLTAEICFTPPLAGSSLVGLNRASVITRAVTEYIRPYIVTAQGNLQGNP